VVGSGTTQRCSALAFCAASGMGKVRAIGISYGAVLSPLSAHEE
jgi:hypothetical protein